MVGKKRCVLCYSSFGAIKTNCTWNFIRFTIARCSNSPGKKPATTAQTTVTHLNVLLKWNIAMRCILPSLRTLFFASCWDRYLPKISSFSCLGSADAHKYHRDTWIRLCKSNVFVPFIFVGLCIWCGKYTPTEEKKRVYMRPSIVLLYVKWCMGMYWWCWQRCW